MQEKNSKFGRFHQVFRKIILFIFFQTFFLGLKKATQVNHVRQFSKSATPDIRLSKPNADFFLDKEKEKQLEYEKKKTL